MYRCRAGKVHRCRGAENRVQNWCRGSEAGAGAEVQVEQVGAEVAGEVAAEQVQTCRVVQVLQQSGAEYEIRGVVCAA